MRVFTATVVNVDDPDQLGRLRLIIPGLYEAEIEFPEWIQPRFPAAGPGAVAAWLIPPVDAVVVVEVDEAGELRWHGGEVGGVNTPPPFLVANYPRRAGMTSPGGLHVLALDDDDGLRILVVNPDDPDGVAAYIGLDGAAGEAKIGLPSGALFTLNATQAMAMTAAGDTLLLDSDNGIALAHHGGAELVSLTDGVALLQGTDTQVVGGAVTITGQGGITLTSDLSGLAPTEPLILGTSLLTDLQARAVGLASALTEIAAGLALIPSSATATAAEATAWATFAADLATALGAGAPYLSTVTETE